MVDVRLSMAGTKGAAKEAAVPVPSPTPCVPDPTNVVTVQVKPRGSEVVFRVGQALGHVQGKGWARPPVQKWATGQGRRTVLLLLPFTGL